MSSDRYFGPVEELTSQLVRIRSVVTVGGENEVSSFLFHHLSRIAEESSLQTDVRLFDNLDDEHGRQNVMFRMFCSEEKPDTVVFFGHLDTVDIDQSMGAMAEHASDPPEFLQAVLREDADADAVRDAMSGNYLFGRGALDMKSGIAAQIEVMHHFLRHPDELKVNIIFLGLTDEENNSAGMLSAVRLLDELKRREDLNYLLAIQSDYTTEHYGVDMGSIGKLLCLVLLRGEPSHSGSPLKGKPVDLYLSAIIDELSLNPVFADTEGAEATPPPVLLRVRDQKPEYTVSTLGSAALYLNVFFLQKGPQECLTQLKEHIQLALEKACRRMELRSTEFLKLAPDHPDKHEKLRVPPVLEVREVLDAVATDASSAAKVFNILHNPKSYPDVREKIIAALDNLLDSSHLTPPYAVVGFVPPYYPSSVTVDPVLRELVAKVVHHAEESYGIRIGMRNYYPYISDASFIAPRQGKAEADVLMNNLAFADEVYDHDFALMKGLDCPAINVGPFGWDAHRKYERVERRYSFSIVPRMLESLVKGLGES